MIPSTNATTILETPVSGFVPTPAYQAAHAIAPWLVVWDYHNVDNNSADPVMAWNPHLKFYNDNRGYVNTRLTKDAMTPDFRVLNYVTTPGSPVSTKAFFAIQDGVPGLVPK